MHVTQHAIGRIFARMNPQAAGTLVGIMESYDGERGTVAYLMLDLPDLARSTDGSNGDTLVAVVVDGSVETVYFRRKDQDMSPAFFGAHKVVDMRAHALRTRIVTQGMDSPEYKAAYEQSKRDSEALARDEAAAGEDMDGRPLTQGRNMVWGRQRRRSRTAGKGGAR